jgi:hypothetical protein
MQTKRINLFQIGLLIVALLFSSNLKAEPGLTSSTTKTEASQTPVVTDLKGTVSDEATSEPLAGVAMQYNGKTYYSDLEGKFSLPIGKTKTGKVNVTLISYQTQQLDLKTAPSGELRIALKPH